MGDFAIVRPYPVLSPVWDGVAKPRLMTPDPKEASIIETGNPSDITFNIGATLRQIDTVYLGFTNLGPGATVSVAVYPDETQVGGGNLGSVTIVAPEYPSTVTHAYVTGPSLPGRIVGVHITPEAGYYPSVGVIAAGLSFKPSFGPEWGAGRPIEDTGTVERLFGGGFGIEDGVAASGYQWTLGDLTNAERRRLYQIVKERRTTRSILVVEPGPDDEINERAHWGLLDKLEAYERIDPLNTKWGLKVRDWA